MTGYADYVEGGGNVQQYGSITDDDFQYNGTEYTIRYLVYNTDLRTVFLELDKCLPPSDFVKLKLDRPGSSDWEDSSPSSTDFNDAGCAEDPFEIQAFVYSNVYPNPLPTGSQVEVTITFR